MPRAETMQSEEDFLKTFSLVILSWILLPVSLATVCFRKVFCSPTCDVVKLSHFRSRDRSDFGERRILVTGVGMSKGLALARSFHLCGHRVIGADFEASSIPCSGRFSSSLYAFRRLPRPTSKADGDAYIKCLVEIIKTEGIELWVSCSGVASAVEDAQAKEAIEQATRCRCIQFDVATTSMLHEKDSFMRACKERRLPIPETYDVKCKDDAIQGLSTSMVNNPERKFILKPVGMDDANRGNMTLLPLTSEAKTKEYLFWRHIQPSEPWILQQFIAGGEEYCTHALVVCGEVKCFVACPSSELLMHYKVLPPDSALSKAMLDFTVKFIQRSPSPESMTGHLSFDFMVDVGSAVPGGRIQRSIYAIECNPRAHTAVVLFAQPGEVMEKMVRAYLTAIDDPENPYLASLHRNGYIKEEPEELVTPTPDTLPRYWLGHDLVSLAIRPLLLELFGMFKGPTVDTSKEVGNFFSHFMAWKEGTFEMWDPLPALALYHVYWPLTILDAWWHKRRWSRINVSTTKVFSC
ncbi:carbamoylphosphate synthase large subunit [Xylariaceae sp. FL0016]|nr:carbamoylphosphate synthase large subunit [Xylariaceae sp. FL0016]